MLEIGSFFGKCSFRGFSGTNGNSLIFPKLWGQGNRYLNGENWGIFEVGTVQYFGEYWGQIPQKASNFGVETGAVVSGDLGDTSGTGTVQIFGDFRWHFSKKIVGPKTPNLENCFLKMQ